MPTAEHFDILIVGAGLAGALAARQLAESGLRVAVFDAAEPGGSLAPGNSLAILGTPVPYTLLLAQRGREEATRMWELTHHNLDLLVRLLLQVQGTADRAGSLRPATDDVEEWRASAEQLQALEYAVELEETPQMGYRVALATFDDVLFDPAPLVATLLSHDNVIVEKGSEVHALKPLPQGELAIWARQHYLTADRVVLANGVHAMRLAESLKSWLRPVYVHIIDAYNVPSLSRPLLLAQEQALVIPQSETWRLVAWGAKDRQVWQRLQQVAAHHCPEAIIEARHSSWVAASQDGLPIVGALPDQQQVYALTGMGPLGLSWVFIAAQRLVRLVTEGEATGGMDTARFAT